MEEILQYIQSHIEIAPYIMMGLLILAGLNLPVSEDVMIFTGAMIAIKNPEHLYKLFICIFIGAYLSDLISYCLGRFLGPQMFKIRWFAKMVTMERIEKVQSFYEKYGGFTLIIGRFIPFGVRNPMFITAGFSRMNFMKFAFFDLIACIITNLTYFSIYYTFGESVVETVKKGNMIIFGIFATSVIIYLVLKKKRVKNSLNTNS